MSGWKVKRSSVLRALDYAAFGFELLFDGRRREKKPISVHREWLAAEFDTRQFVINSAISGLKRHVVVQGDPSVRLKSAVHLVLRVLAVGGPLL